MQNMDAPLHFGQRKLVHQIILRGLSTNIILLLLYKIVLSISLFGLLLHISTIFGIMHKPLCQQIWYYGNRTLSTQIQLNDCTSIFLILSMQLYMYIQREKLRTCKQITDKSFACLQHIKVRREYPCTTASVRFVELFKGPPDHYFSYGPKCMTEKNK